MKRTKALESTAYHEAGHAVVAWQLGFKAKSVSIIPEPGESGRYIHEPYFKNIHPEHDTSPEAERRVKNQALVCFAGAAAERRFNVKGWRHDYAQSDFENAAGVLQFLVGSDKEHQALVNEIDSKVQKMIEDPFIWSCIERLAAALLKRHELSGKQAVRILRDHRKRQ